MFKYIVGSITAIMVSATSSIAAPPWMALAQVNTPYGKFTCTQRAQNKFYSLGASSVETNDGGGVWAIYGENRLAVWCRGEYAFISVAGPNASGLRDEIQQVF